MTHKIFLIRHGESTANVNPSLYHGPDQAIILTQLGVEQALNISKTIAELHNLSHQPKIISSIHNRAKLTASIACHLIRGVEIHHDYRINECPPVTRIGDSFESNKSVRDRVKSLIDQHDGTLFLFCHGELMWHLDPNRGAVANTEIRIYDRKTFIEKHLSKDNILIQRTAHI